MDRHGLSALAMTCVGEGYPHDDEVEKGIGSVLTLSLRGGSVSERRGNPSCLARRKRGVRIALWITVDRHGLRPRDDKDRDTR